MRNFESIKLLIMPLQYYSLHLFLWMEDAITGNIINMG